MANDTRQLAVVTGGNRGLGLEACRQLASQGYRVVLTARDGEQARRAAASLSSVGSVRAEQLDVKSQASIAAFAERLRAAGDAISALINNAGISMKGFNVEVVRGTLAVNFFGALHVTQALGPLVQDGGNIVMVSSGMGELSAYSRELKARFLADDLTLLGLIALVDEFTAEVAAGQHEAHGWPSSAYRVSKAALNALTRILAKDSPRLHINSVCPGWVKTDMGGPGASRSVETGARGIVWAATLGSGGPHGGFFRDGKPIPW